MGARTVRLELEVVFWDSRLENEIWGVEWILNWGVVYIEFDVKSDVFLDWIFEISGNHYIVISYKG